MAENTLVKEGLQTEHSSSQHSDAEPAAEHSEAQQEVRVSEVNEADETGWADKKRGRVFHIVQNERHPETGEVLMTPDQIAKGCSYGSIKEWAWIKHDKDLWTEQDEEKSKYAKAGEPKADHFHIAMRLDDPRSVAQIANWFGVPPQYVEVPFGRGAFLDTVEYLTHEHPRQQVLGKHHYDDGEIHSNFGWRERVDEHVASGRKASLKPLDALKQAVMKDGMSLREARDKEPVLYANYLSSLRMLRQDYLANQAPPDLRVNYYVGGGSETGKTVLARLFARMLYPELPPEECYFEAGASKVALQAYDGQPVVIWDDYRAVELLLALGDRGTVWRVFDTSPGRAQANVKHGAVGMTQAVNIVTGVKHYSEFLEALAGKYRGVDGTEHQAEDQVQSLRRFPFVAEVAKEQILLLANKGFAGLGEYTAYSELVRMQANMREVITTIEAIADESDREAFRREMGDQMLSRMVAAHLAARPPRSLSIEEARSQLSGRVLVEDAEDIASSRAAVLDGTSPVLAQAQAEADGHTAHAIPDWLARSRVGRYPRR